MTRSIQTYPNAKSFKSNSCKNRFENIVFLLTDYDYEDHSSDKMEHAFSDAIDQLALEFSGR